MGDEQQHDPDPRDTEVIVGEIMIAGRLNEEGRRHGGDDKRGRPRGARLFDEDFIKEVVTERVIKGRALTDVAAEYGISHETVRRWSGDAQAARNVTKPDVIAIRAGLAAELETVGREAWKIHKGALDNKTRLEALGRVESTIRARAILEGANAPVRHDVSVTAVTEAEKELQEMIMEARAREAVNEQAVIDAASADPDL